MLKKNGNTWNTLNNKILIYINIGTLRLETTASCTSVHYYFGNAIACIGNKSLITHTTNK
jgi:hypothetical protein